MKRAWLLAGLLVLVLGSGVVAQEPSQEASGPWLDGRVEMPEYGYAVDIPEDWVAVDLRDGLSVQLIRLAVIFDDDRRESDTDHLLGAMYALQEAGAHVFAMDRSMASGCGFGAIPGADVDLDRDADNLYAYLSGEEAYADVERPEAVDLSAGSARRVSYGWPDGYHAAHYLGHGADAGFTVWCTGPETPDDDWLSVAESFEFLPAASEPPLTDG